MTEGSIRTLITDFLAATGTAVYAEGQVPMGAQTPYLTYALTVAGFGKPGTLTVTAWAREGFAATVQEVQKVQALLPCGQELVVGASGALLLRFERSEMLTPVGDRQMRGGKIRMTLIRYDRQEGGEALC